jgi:hypothetical protein
MLSAPNDLAPRVRICALFVAHAAQPRAAIVPQADPAAPMSRVGADPPRLLGPEHERILREAMRDRDVARGRLLALMFTLPGAAWRWIRRRDARPNRAEGQAS